MGLSDLITLTLAPILQMKKIVALTYAIRASHSKKFSSEAGPENNEKGSHYSRQSLLQNVQRTSGSNQAWKKCDGEIPEEILQSCFFLPANIPSGAFSESSKNKTKRYECEQKLNTIETPISCGRFKVGKWGNCLLIR